MERRTSWHEIKIQLLFGCLNILFCCTRPDKNLSHRRLSGPKVKQKMGEMWHLLIFECVYILRWYCMDKWYNLRVLLTHFMDQITKKLWKVCSTCIKDLVILWKKSCSQKTNSWAISPNGPDKYYLWVQPSLLNICWLSNKHHH